MTPPPEPADDPAAPAAASPEPAPAAGRARGGEDGALTVLVLGMHRSGTSAVAGALDAAGVSAGAGHELMPPRAENPRFFGERLEVMGFDDRLLRSLGWAWDGPAASPHPAPPDRSALVEEGRALVRDLFGVGRARLVKDPRISLLLPWWRQMLLDRFVAVVSVRAPEEVAWSLSVRNGFPFELGLALWLAYHRHLAAGLDGLPVVLVDYAALTADPGAMAPRLLDAVRGLGVTVERDPADARAAAIAAIEPALRRATQPGAVAGSAIAADVRRAAGRWMPDGVQVFDRFSMAVEAPAGWEDAFLALRREATQLTEDLDASRRSGAHAHATAEAARSAATDATARGDRLAAALAEATERAATAERRAADLQRRLSHLTDPGWLLRSGTRRVAGEVAGRAGRLPLPVALPGAIGRSPLFDAEWYLAQHEDVRAAGMDPWRHFRRFGAREGRDPNALFHVAWYLEQNPDVAAAGLDPLDHYLRHGAAEGRDPSPLFDSDWYLEQHPDVAEAGLNPLVHYLRHGAAEGRLPRPGAAPGTGAAGVRAPGETHAVGLAGRSELIVAGGGARRRPRARDGGSLAAWLRDLPPGTIPASGLPAGARLLVVAADGTELPQLPGLTAEAFPTPVTDGGPVALPPAEISWLARLATARAAGAAFLLIPEAAGELIAGVPGFAMTVAARFPTVAQEAGAGTLLDLRRVLAAGEGGVAAALREALAACRDRRAADDASAGVARTTDGDPSVLDWTRDGLAGGLGGAIVFRPADHRLPLPYPDASVDIVVVDAGDAGMLAEAERIASAAVVVADGATRARVERRPGTGAPAMPSVSIVIPTWNGSRHLRGCLATLAETLPPDVTIEVLVVDDASEPGEAATIAALVATLPAARLLVNDTNQGFIGSVTRGTDAATGELLILLNDDTLLLPGWLEAIVRTFGDHPDAGVVGGRLLYPDGRLQEAGGLVFRDGSAAKHGAGLPDPDAPLAAALRDTDYVSGALLATPRALFTELGGLDRAYGFGYYEDTDYCFRVRAAGRRVLVQPAATIVHVEGGTAGTDTSTGPKRSQVENADRFTARWAAELARQPVRPATSRADDWFAAAIRPVPADPGSR